MNIGCHVSIAGGIWNAPKNAHDLGCEVMQIFTRPPQGGPAPELTPDIIKKFKLKAKSYNLKASYLIPDASKKQPLFLSGRGKRVNVRGIERMVQKYAKVAGISKNVSPHTLRHTFATDLLIAGADIRSVQSLLGHSNISTTQVYTHVTDQHLREVHRKYHNRNHTEIDPK